MGTRTPSLGPIGDEMHHWGEFFSTKIYKTQTGFCTNIGAKTSLVPSLPISFMVSHACLSIASSSFFVATLRAWRRCFVSHRVHPSQYFLSTLFSFFYVFKLLHLKKRKTLEIKIKDGNPSIKSARQMKTQVDTTQRKNKRKQSAKIM